MKKILKEGWNLRRGLFTGILQVGVSNEGVVSYDYDGGHLLEFYSMSVCTALLSLCKDFIANSVCAFWLGRRVGGRLEFGNVRVKAELFSAGLNQHCCGIHVIYTTRRL